ncbi:MAG TPA: hypothetical protein VEK15_19555 [Vicinamibacteria bacterium]|nr:hypothetical protein [Vicinamibacteria bacterium]
MIALTMCALLLVAEQPDARAQAVVDRLIGALGGEEGWSRARFIQFTFAREGRRLHIAWDRWTGRYRLEATNDAGIPYSVIMNLNTRQGNAILDGRPLRDRELSDYLNRATRIWAGETYWLLMPYKLRDPGVVVAFDGEESVGGRLYDRLHLRFEDVGLTPGDEFWVYVNRETGLVDRWRFRLESGFEGDYRWSGWQRFGGILLATERRSEAGETIRFEDIFVSDVVPEEVFSLSGAPSR